SLQISMDARTDDWQPRPNYRVHEWSLPDGMGQLPDWPGLTGDRWYLRQDTYLALSGGVDFLDGHRSRGGLGGGFGGGLGDGRMALRSEMAQNAAAPAPP